MSKPQIVIIPGAWHAAHYFDLLRNRLESLDYSVHIRQMPAVGATNPPPDLSEDVAAARSLVQQAIGQGNDVIVIAHSWGGIVASSGLTGLGKREREAEGKKGGITWVGYMAAFLVPEGVSLIDAIGGKAPAPFNVQGAYAYVIDADGLYSDLPISERQDLSAKLQPHSFATFTTKTEEASWRTIPTSYLLCEEDQLLSPSAQEAMIKRVQSAGGVVKVHRLKAGHSPFLSQPDGTVAWIETMARDKVVRLVNSKL